jgi:hypothetical protein
MAGVVAMAVGCASDVIVLEETDHHHDDGPNSHTGEFGPTSALTTDVSFSTSGGAGSSSTAPPTSSSTAGDATIGTESSGDTTRGDASGTSAGAAGPWADCFGDEECAPELACPWLEFSEDLPHGMCTIPCDGGPAGCPEVPDGHEAICVAGNVEGGPWCAFACAGDDGITCPAGMLCWDPGANGLPYCLPN